jgi:oxaloacetate decarboxylase beta subunit
MSTFYGSDKISGANDNNKNLKKSIIISIVAVLIYLSVSFFLPLYSVSATNSESDDNNDSNGVREYLTDFDSFNKWELDFEIFDISKNKVKELPNNQWSITKDVNEAYSGGYSANFSFHEFSGSGGIWLERKFTIEQYTKYLFEIEYFIKLGEKSKLTPGIKPIVYIGKKNPEDINDFSKRLYAFTSDWTDLKYDYEVEVDEIEYYWFAFGIFAEYYPPSTNQPNGVNDGSTGLNFTCYIDNVKVTLTEVELEAQDLFLIYIKASLMFIIGGVLIYLAIRKQYEPLLLLPIGTGIILTNIPFVGMMEPGGILNLIYEGGIKTGLFPLLIFLGIGAMTDFGPMLANPKTSLLGAAAQFGIFTTLIGALLLGFTLAESSSIGIIGGADGPTAIYLSIHLAPHLLGPIAIAAYSYMALVPIIQPPIIHALTSEKERKIKMEQMRFVSPRERILFPIGVIIICAFVLPAATPLVGMLMFGNLMRESGVVQRLANAASNELINIVTIFLGVAVGATMIANTFLTYQTIAIIILGLIAFSIGTATGVIFGKMMSRFSGGKINPMIGAAGVSAVPMAARVVQKEGIKADPANHLLMHAMGPNVAGVIGSAVAAGVLLTFVGG